jgi:hypothetical protein
MAVLTNINFEPAVQKTKNYSKKVEETGGAKLPLLAILDLATASMAEVVKVVTPVGKVEQGVLKLTFVHFSRYALIFTWFTYCFL